MQVAFHTLGCRLNQSETSILAQAFAQEGYEVVEQPNNVDVCVINTCTVTGVSDAKCRNSIRKVIRENPKAKVAVIGCYAESGFKSLSEIEGVDLIVGNQEKLNLLHYLPEEKLDASRIVKDKIEKTPFEINTIGQSTSRVRANLKIQDGCDFMCSFCIIPHVRGRARGRVFQNLLDEAQELIKQGFREIVLTGVNLGTYDVEEKTLVDICDELNKLELPRVRISSIEPTTVDNALFERMADPEHNLTPYLHLPLQSGSDKVLQAMRRRYLRKDYTDFIEHAHKIVPNLSIGTDVLLGSPEESEEDFQETLSLLRDFQIDYAHAFTYSERQGTPDQRKEQIPYDERKRRTQLVRNLSSSKKMEMGSRFLGQNLNVLFEEEDEGFWQGYTEQYLRVKVKSSENLQNKILKVNIDEVCGEWVLASLN